MRLNEFVNEVAAVGRGERTNVYLMTGLPGVGKTSNMRVLADMLSHRFGYHRPVCFLDLDVFGFRIGGRWYVQTLELARNLQLVYQSGVRTFVLAGTCSNFTDLCHQFKDVDRVDILFLRANYARILEVMKLREGEGPAREEVEHVNGDSPLEDSVEPETISSIETWERSMFDIVTKRASTYGFHVTEISYDSALSSAFSSDSNAQDSGRGRPLVRYVERGAGRQGQPLLIPNSEEIFFGVNFGVEPPRLKGINVPGSYNLTPRTEKSAVFHPWPLNLENLSPQRWASRGVAVTRVGSKVGGASHD